MVQDFMGFEVVDSDEIDYGEEEKQTKPAQTTGAQRPLKTGSASVQPASTQSVSFNTDYTPQPNKAGKPRIYEVVVETVSYLKSGPKINYSHRIRYPGDEDFFETH